MKIHNCRSIYIRRIFLLFAVLLLLPTLSGCGLLPDTPGWQRAGQAALEAATAPQTWAPLAGAVLFATDDFDRRAADWAGEHTPVFGSPAGAEKASDWLFGTTVAAYGGTLLAGNADAPARWQARFDNAVTGGAAVLATGGTTLLAKEAVGRERPDGSGAESFPSLHAAEAAVFSTLAARNLEGISLTGRQRTMSRAGLAALTLGTAWARIEAGRHYPSDVLAGAALGHFFGVFFTEAFFPESALGVQPEIGFREGRFGLRLQVVY